MARIFTLILDICFPPREEELLVRTLSIHTIDTLYQEVSHAGTTALLPYSNQAIRALVHEAKFHNNRHAQTLLAQALILYVEAHQLHDYICIPIPLSHKRWRERGYNQVSRVLTQAKLPMATNVLYRSRHTVTQTSLKRTDRLQNLKGAFAVKGTLPPQNILLIDDVLTTGATLDEARATLAPYVQPGQTITCVALAH